jgi:hypothetical protein
MARRWAVLIDTENVAADVADPLFERVAKWGDASVRRMFGDFDGNHSGWKAAARRHSIEFVHLPDMVPGKNGADIALVIDAVDLMHSGHVDGFCLVSSDSDFTRLAGRLRAEGKTVRGVGRASTADAFRLACSQFIAVEELAAAVVRAEAVCKPSDVLGIAFARLGPGEWHKLGKLGHELSKLGPACLADGNAASGSLLKRVEKCGAFRIRRAPDGHPEIAWRS